MLRFPHFARGLLVALTLGVLAPGTASATMSLYLDGSYNQTAIDFTASGVHHSVNGGGVVGGYLTGGSLHNQKITYLYCLQWNLDVLVPATYGNTLVNSAGLLHKTALPMGTSVGNGAFDIAKEVAWLLVNRTSVAGSDVNKQAGLQALLWQEVTPNFVLTSTNTALVGAYNDDVAALRFAETHGTLGDDRSLVAFISPSTDGDVTNHNQGLVGYTAGINLGGGTVNPVPEPPTLIGAVAGLIGLGYRLRRRITRIS